MTSRRSFFALVGQGIAATMAAAVGTGAAVAEREYVRKPLPPKWLEDIIDPKVHEVVFTPLSQDFVDDIYSGRSHTFVYSNPAYGPAVIEHQPVNLRSDGTLIHRQHHPVDFPPHRE